MQEWHITSLDIDEVVVAVDQWAAWNTLRTRPLEDFGLIVTAAPTNDEVNAIPVHTATLMRQWGRLSDALLCDDVARAKGLL